MSAKITTLRRGFKQLRKKFQIRPIMKALIKKFLNLTLIAFLSLTSTNSYVFAQNIDQFALPTGGQVVSGNIDINQPSVGRLDVNQTTQQGIVNWNTFNVGSSPSVYFNQPTNPLF